MVGTVPRRGCGGETVHTLKTHPAPFQAVWDGTKKHDLRKADRPYAVGDILILREWDPATEKFSDREVEAEVTYITKGGGFGLPADLCIMSLNVLWKGRSG